VYIYNIHQKKKKLGYLSVCSCLLSDGPSAICNQAPVILNVVSKFVNLLRLLAAASVETSV
jgi:hypothetical protein